MSKPKIVTMDYRTLATKQMECDRILRDHAAKISLIVGRFGGSAHIVHDSVEISVPEEHKDEVMQEIMELGL